MYSHPMVDVVVILQLLGQLCLSLAASTLLGKFTLCP